MKVECIYCSYVFESDLDNIFGSEKGATQAYNFPTCPSCTQEMKVTVSRESQQLVEPITQKDEESLNEELLYDEDLYFEMIKKQSGLRLNT